MRPLCKWNHTLALAELSHLHTARMLISYLVWSRQGFYVARFDKSRCNCRAKCILVGQIAIAGYTDWPSQMADSRHNAGAHQGQTGAKSCCPEGGADDKHDSRSSWLQCSVGPTGSGFALSCLWSSVLCGTAWFEFWVALRRFGIASKVALAFPHLTASRAWRARICQESMQWCWSSQKMMRQSTAVSKGLSVTLACCSHLFTFHLIGGKSAWSPQICTWALDLWHLTSPPLGSLQSWACSRSCCATSAWPLKLGLPWHSLQPHSCQLNT